MELFEDLLFKGGGINIILFVAYVVSLIIIFERFIFFTIKRGHYNTFMSTIRNQLENSDPRSTEFNVTHLPYPQSFYFQLTDRYMRHSQFGPSEREKLVIIFISECNVELQRGQTALHIIGTLSPMLGLLGTMLGLVKSFRGIEAMGGSVDIQILAGGIWEAMLTTIAGLIVGIIALLALRVFQSRITLVTNRLEDLALYLDVALNRVCST